MATGNDQITFVDWDHRPTTLVGGKAFAVLGRNDPWVIVDALDVGHTGGVMTETAWRRMFQRYFGPLDLSLISRARAPIKFVNWGDCAVGPIGRKL
jgi:hypothetical protein